MADTSEDIDVVYAWNIKEMTREQLVNEVLSCHKQIKKWRKQRKRLMRFYRMIEEFTMPTPEELAQLAPGEKWNPPPIQLPSHEQLESWWWQSRKFLAEEASWLGF